VQRYLLKIKIATTADPIPRSGDATVMGGIKECIKGNPRALEIFTDNIQDSDTCEIIVGRMLTEYNKNKVDGWKLISNILKHLSIEDAQKVREEIIKQKSDFFELSRLITELTSEAVDINIMLGALNIAKQTELVDALQPAKYESLKDLDYQDLFNFKEFSLHKNAGEEEIEAFLDRNREISQLSITKEQFSPVLKGLCEIHQLALQKIQGADGLVQKADLQLVETSSELNNKFKKDFKSDYSPKVQEQDGVDSKST
jgi:hypothetical protein